MCFIFQFSHQYADKFSCLCKSRLGSSCLECNCLGALTWAIAWSHCLGVIAQRSSYLEGSYLEGCCLGVALKAIAYSAIAFGLFPGKSLPAWPPPWDVAWRPSSQSKWTFALTADAYDYHLGVYRLEAIALGVVIMMPGKLSPGCCHL